MKMLMGALCLMLSVWSGNQVFAQEKENSFNKKDFYAAMAGNNEAAVDNQLALLKTVAVKDKDAFEGTLLMKKAGIGGGPKKKLNLFKAGHKKLEGVLEKDSLNPEYRFLRLMIQEHAPGILGYKGELEKDSQFISENFKKMPPVVQQAVKDYSKNSKFLKSSNL
ncbi:MAG: hypothetical protein ABIU63_01970 [Chitinophagaceae bacterium]